MKLTSAINTNTNYYKNNICNQYVNNNSQNSELKSITITPNSNRIIFGTKIKPIIKLVIDKKQQ